MDYVLSETDRAKLQEAMRYYRNILRGSPEWPNQEGLPQSQDIVVAVTDYNGIASPTLIYSGPLAEYLNFSGSTIYAGYCNVYFLVPADGLITPGSPAGNEKYYSSLQLSESSQALVFSLWKIPADSIVIAVKDKAGSYWAVANQSPATPTNIVENITSYSLTTSWTSTGTSLSLPSNTTWLITAQINAQIVSSSSGAGDTISCRLYDGSSVVGCPIEFCMAVCDSLTYVDAATISTVYNVPDIGTGTVGISVSLEGIINTATASTGTILGCGSLAGGQLVGVRLS